MLTDAQLTAVIVALGAAGGAFVTFLKWAFGQWLVDRAKDREDRAKDRDERREDRIADREAMKAVAVAMTTMSLKFDAFEKQLTQVDGNVGKVAHEIQEITGRHTVPPPLVDSPTEYRVTRAATELGRKR